MQIYIAAAHRRHTYARSLTALLEADGHHVYLFCRDAAFMALLMFAWGEPDWWIDSPEAAQVCRANLERAVAADLVIYAGGGCDAWAEVGAAVGAGVPVWGLRMTDEPIGINRHMIDDWFDDSLELLAALTKCQPEPEVASGT
jgi:hypothetical protein